MALVPVFQYMIGNSDFSLVTTDGADEQLAAALASIVAARSATLQVLKEVPGLNSKARAITKEYLDNFFRRAEVPGKLLASFEKNCVGTRR